ncbi:MAG: glucosyltransferase domain-containing protein [Faecousia sp.]
MKCLRQEIEQNKKWLIYALLATFFWGLAAHMYCFTNNSFSHDSLNEFHAAIFGNEWKIRSGRIFVPLYRDLFRSDATLPWLIGIMALLWICLAVFLTIRMFRIESKVLIFLTAGIFAANISVSATAATYLHDLDCDMFGLLLAVAAACLWDRVPWGFAAGAGLIAVSLGLYQAYISVTITLVLIICILDLLHQQSFRYVFFRGIKAIGMLLLGGVLYYIAMQTVVRLSHVQLASGRHNFMDTAAQLTPKIFLQMVIGAYKDCFHRLMNAYSSYPAVMIRGATILLLGVSVIAVISGLRNKNVRIPERILCVVLIGLLPLGMNVLYVLTIGNVHDLMVYAIWLTYLLALLSGDWLVKRWKECGHAVKEKTGKCLNQMCMLLVLLILFGNVQFSNGMYLEKDMEYDAYLSLMTRVVYRMEDYDGYVPGETPVFFSGLPQNHNPSIPGMREYQSVVGMWSTDVLYTPERIRFQAYFDYILCTPVNLVEEEQWEAMWEDPRISELPCYPAGGCIAMIDDVLVVKLG